MNIKSGAFFNNLRIAVLATARVLILLLPAAAGLCLAQNAAKTDSSAPFLPVPTGRYPVGTTIFHFTDPARKYAFPPEANRSREIMVQIWYPAGKTIQAPAAAYLTNSALITAAMKKEQYLDLPPEVIDQWKSIQTHAATDVPLIAKPKRLPLLIFSHGFGMSRSNYTSIIENLASLGYIVAAIDHPYTGLTVLPDNRVLSFGDDNRRGPEFAVERVEAMAADVSFVLDTLLDKKSTVGGRFAGRIDAERAGMLGHSLGGAAALEICRSSVRFKACADLDGSVWGKVETEGVNRPYLVMLNVPGAARRPPPAMQKQRDDEWTTVVTKNKTKAFIVKIEGTYHLSFTDIPFIAPRALLEENGADIEPRRGLEIITKVLDAFFTRYLTDGSGTLFESAAKSYPEINIKEFN